MNTNKLIYHYIHYIYIVCYEDPGECVDSIYLGSVPAIDSGDCVKKCQSYNGCMYGTFRPDDSNLNMCLLFQTCTRLETGLCPNCLTSHYFCK